MTNEWKEQVMRNVESYAKAVKNESYDNVLNILHSRFNQLDNILSSKEAKNIYEMSTGDGFRRLCDKRYALRMKIYCILDLMNDVSELRYGKY